MVQGTPYAPCALRKATDTLSFGFGGPDGPAISVPYSALIYPYGAPSNMGKINAADGTPLCYLGVIGTGGTIYLLGDTFTRSAYLVYDVDNQQVAMAPASFNSRAEHTVEIPAGTGLPGVRSTNSYLLPTATPSA
jgi:Eukaryotic aspartyl protease